MTLHHLRWVAGLPVLVSGMYGAAIAAPAAEATLPQITVRSTLGTSSLEQTPASVSMVDGNQVRDRQMQVNLSESLSGVPGLMLQNRQNYAQDLQLSIRGHGSRSTFGVRGIRIYIDGIPATMPDGQGQTNNIDLASVERLEVLRGPYSALYGNASGGVISAYTERGEGKPNVSSTFAIGSDGQKRLGLKAKGETNGIGYVLSTSRFLTDGYRDHSAADKNLTNARIDLRPDEYSTLTLVANAVNIDAQDPGGLSPADWEKSPRDGSRAASFNSRKSIQQTQAGLTYERQLDGHNSLRLMAYAGERKMQQFQAIDPKFQGGVNHAGGVIDLKRSYGGADARWSNQIDTSTGQVNLVAGLSMDMVKENRRGFENFRGSEVGVLGNIRRNERNTLTSIDPYAQASWAFAPDWKLDAGLRWSNVSFESRDKYLGNGDESGEASYHQVLPVLSLQHQFNASTNLYASLGRGFETGTFNEISYRPDDALGLNFGLRPSKSISLEIGIKQRFEHKGLHGNWTASVFQTNTDDEIASYDNYNQRATFFNAGATRRRGVELSTQLALSQTVTARAAFTHLDATFRDSFCKKTGEDCVSTGNRLPGTAKTVAFLGLDWKPTTAWRAGVDMRYVGNIAANDINSVYAPAYTIAGASLGYEKSWGQWTFNAFARLDNLFDKRYVGSTIVNESNGRFYESAPGRQWMTGVSAGYQF